MTTRTGATVRSPGTAGPGSTHRRRSLAALWALVGTALVVTWGAAPATADDEVRIYSVPGGDASMDVRATCSGDTCAVVPVNTDAFFPGTWTEPLTVTDGRGQLVLPDTCGTSDPSPYASHGRITLTVTISGTELVATRDEPGRVIRPRPNYTCSSKDLTLTQRLTLVVPATPSPSPSPPVVATPSSSAPAGAAGPAASTTDGTAASADGPGGLTVSRLAGGAADAPSVLSGLTTPDRVDLRKVLVAAVVTVVLVLLVAFPTSLLNSAVETGSDRVSAWWRRRRGVAEDPDDAGVPWWWAAGGVLGAGVVSSFVDPQFGLNAGSARTLVSVVVGVAVEVLVGWVVVSAVVRRTVPGAVATFSFTPASLLLVVGAVVLTRVTGFEPGIVFGLVAGVGFAALSGAAAQARVTLVPLGVGAAVGLAAWAGYGLVDGATGTVGVLATETLSATAVAGLVALPLALLPVPGLSGHVVFRWNRRVWAAFYSVGLLAFLVVLMPTPYAWDEVGWSLTAWVLGYVAYLVVAIAAWWSVRRGLHRAGASELETADPTSV